MNKEDDDKLYDIHNYADSDLFTMLDLTNPTDRELEAKILMTIDKYDDESDLSKKPLKSFFERVYKHFFEDDDEEEEEGYNEGNITLTEGLTNMDEEQIVKSQGVSMVPTPSSTTSAIAAPDRLLTTNLQYDKSVLNPLLKETQKRVLQLDSAFRDFENYPSSTSYLINLSEVLNNVVSLRLHSVSIPYTWYNISNVYNANYFILEGVTPGVNGVYDYKFEIVAGSYNIPELIIALNASVAALAIEYPEVNFGTTAVKYNELTTKLDLILDIQNVFTETQYYLYFDVNTNAFDVDVRKKSISGFLGYTASVIPDQIAIPTPSGVEGTVVSVENTYMINSIYSNFNYMYNATGSITGTTNSLSQNDLYEVVADSADVSGNNYMTFINYEGPYNYDPVTSVVLNTVKISFLDLSGNYTLGTIMEDVNRSLLSSESFTQKTSLRLFDISYNMRDVSGGPITDVTLQRFQLIFSLEPAVITNTSNMKQIVVFPDETGLSSPLWTGNNSCFMFDENSVFRQPNSITGDIFPVNTKYVIDTVPTMSLICTKSLYDNVYNNYTITINTSDFYNYVDGYSMNDYVGVMNYTDQYKNSEINMNLSLAKTSTSKQYLKPDVFYDIGSNKVRMQFDMLTSFDQTDYTLDMSSCFIYVSPPGLIDLSSSTISITDPSLNVFQGSTLNTIFPVVIDNTNNKINVQPKPGQGNSDVGDYIITFTPGTYRTPGALVTSVNNTFASIRGLTDRSGTDLNGLNLTQTEFGYDISGTNYDWTFTYKIKNQMSAQDYKVVFTDTAESYANEAGVLGTSWKSYLGFTDTSYNLVSSNVNNYMSEIVSDEDVFVDVAKMITIDASNNTFLFSPYSNIKGLYAPDNSSEVKIIVPNGSYGLYQLYNEINSLLNVTPETYGSIMYSDFNANGIESTVFQINVNKSFSAKDYELVFFNDKAVDLACNLNKNTPGAAQTTTWDITIGWLMGFRTYPEYMLSPFAANNNLYVTVNNYTYNSTTEIITLTGDACVDLHIFKNLYLIIDDFTQNHLNDGLITGIRMNPNADPPNYSSRGTRVDNPITNKYQSSIFNSVRPGMGLTGNQLYAANVIAEENFVIQTKRIYSDPPYVKDMFGLIPLKIGSFKHGDVFTEYGGTLQDNDRKYFGPVNITKMNIKLLNDRGDVLNLNDSNWSFSIVFEYLYNFKGI